MHIDVVGSVLKEGEREREKQRKERGGEREHENVHVHIHICVCTLVHCNQLEQSLFVCVYKS